MKTPTLVAFFALLSFSAVAQNGYFINAEYGEGSSNIRVKGYDGSTVQTNPVLGYHAQVNVGDQVNNFRFNIGLGYLRTGVEEDLTFSGVVGLMPGKVYQYYTHITMPVMLGYVVHVGKKLSVVPSAGIVTSYNLGEKEQAPDGTSNESGKDFYSNYDRISFFATAKVDVEYRLYKRISIMAGAEALYMFSNMLVIPDNAVNEDKSSLNNYAYIYSAGIKWDFVKRKKKDAVPADKSTK